MSGEPIIGSMSSHTRTAPWLPGRYVEEYFAIVDGTLYELVFRAPWVRRAPYARDFLRVAESLEVGPG